MLARIASPVAAVLVALIVSTSFVGPDRADQQSGPPSFDPWIDTSNRDDVVGAYRAVFDRPVPALEWTGRTEGCRAGGSSDALRRETLIRISWYRAMAGVPADVVEDPIMSDKAQSAALMMSMEGELTHEPGSDFACFSPVGREAAANSNLYLGRTGPSAIDGYIEDPGDRNIDVGHRSTILHPPTTTMGIGHVSGSGPRYPANALWVFDDDVFEREYQTREPERFVAWPPRGFVPEPVVYPRWSFSLQEADFSRATVSMTDDDTGRAVPLKVVARISKEGEIPSSVLVWEPDLSSSDGGGDRAYTVTVADVVGPDAARPTSHSYRVVVVGVDRPRSGLRALLNPPSTVSGGLVGSLIQQR